MSARRLTFIKITISSFTQLVIPSQSNLIAFRHSQYKSLIEIQECIIVRQQETRLALPELLDNLLVSVVLIFFLGSILRLILAFVGVLLEQAIVEEVLPI